MFKHTAKMLVLFLIFASITMFIGCQEQQTINSPEPVANLSKVPTLVIPAGASIVTANLKLYAWSWAGNPQTVELHNITANWSCPVSWSSFAGAFNPAVITTFNAGSSPSPEWKTINITTTVQGWVSGGMNYGLLLKNEDATQGLAQFLSMENIIDPNLAPYLEVTLSTGEVIEVSPLYDTYINSLDVNISYCSEPTLYCGMNNLGTGDAHKYPLIRFDVQPGNEVCETAYAFGGTIATCFLNLSPISANNWGWTNLITPGYTGQWPLYAGAAGCDITKGTLVGHVDVSYIAGTITIDYVLDPGYNLAEKHVWIGTDPLPKKNGIYQTAPGKFNYNNMDPVVLTGQTGNKYVAVHAGVCWFE